MNTWAMRAPDRTGMAQRETPDVSGKSQPHRGSDSMHTFHHVSIPLAGSGTCFVSHSLRARSKSGTSQVPSFLRSLRSDRSASHNIRKGSRVRHDYKYQLVVAG